MSERKERAMSRQLLLVGVVAAALVAGSAPAGATVIDREQYSGTAEYSLDDCDFTLDVASTFYGQSLVRMDKTGQAFLDTDILHFRNVLTNPDTGQWFVVRGHRLFHDIRATQVDGTIYEFVAVEAGQPLVLEDAEGNVIVRDRGVIRHTYLFDTLGDGQPGGEFIANLQLVVHGPHPGFAEDFPLCEIAAELTGVPDQQ
jgi:hypothetical protein